MEIEFKWPHEDNRYRLFSDEHENNTNVLFHGTTEKFLQPILEHGFDPSGNLNSISFARTSSVPLAYACDKRCDTFRGVVIAVRFDDLDIKGIRQEGDVVYLDDLNNQPKVIEYCYISDDYQHR